MRIALFVFLLSILTIPAQAHDGLWGIMKCYNGNHCRQDTLVFGTIVAEDSDSYTIQVQKTLRGKQTQEQRIRIRKKGWYDARSKRPPKIHDGLLASYLSKDHEPRKPLFLVRSKTAHWHMMATETGFGPSDKAALDRFVRSGGEDDDFYFTEDSVYLRKHDGTSERIFHSPSRHRHPVQTTPLSFVRRQSSVKSIATATAVVLLLAFVAAMRIRRVRT